MESRRKRRVGTAGAVSGMFSSRNRRRYSTTGVTGDKHLFSGAASCDKRRTIQGCFG
uniref:Uncharacterized protein n=1 Tax=Helianthus annuus TaxID=4232 RepID=A0A251SXL8_HELAN